jgi:hypothetical protein
MADTIGIQGLLSSDDSTTTKDLYHLLNSGIAPYSFSAQIPTEVAAITPFASTPPVAGSSISGLRSWTANFSGRFPRSSPAMGHEGLATFGSMSVGSGYLLGLTGWSLALSVESFDSTELSSTPPTWRSFVPGLISATGTFDVRIDDTTAIEVGTEGAITLRTNVETTNDNEFSGNIIVTNVAPSVAVGSRNTAQISFVFTGPISVDGDAPMFPVASAGTPDALGKPDITDVVLRAAGNIDYDGSAFWTSLNINCAIGSPIDVTGTLQGVGALALGS